MSGRVRPRARHFKNNSYIYLYLKTCGLSIYSYLAHFVSKGQLKHFSNTNSSVTRKKKNIALKIEQRIKIEFAMTPPCGEDASVPVQSQRVPMLVTFRFLCPAPSPYMSPLEHLTLNVEFSVGREEKVVLFTDGPPSKAL